MAYEVWLSLVLGRKGPHLDYTLKSVETFDANKKPTKVVRMGGVALSAAC